MSVGGVSLAARVPLWGARCWVWWCVLTGLADGQVASCIEIDSNASPFVDRVRRCAGEEYEYILQHMLINRGIPFESEDALRAQGFSKTPDVKLAVPVGVVDRAGRARLVNWVDSKAMFGDNHTHFTHNGPQLRGYVNRFGPGMVLYWSGVVDTIGVVAPHPGSAATSSDTHGSQARRPRHTRGRGSQGGGGGSHGPGPKKRGQQGKASQAWAAAAGTAAEDVVTCAAFPTCYVLPGSQGLPQSDPCFAIPEGELSATF